MPGKLEASKVRKFVLSFTDLPFPLATVHRHTFKHSYSQLLIATTDRFIEWVHMDCIASVES